MKVKATIKNVKPQTLITGQIGRIYGSPIIVEDELEKWKLKPRDRTTRDKIYEALEKLTPKEKKPKWKWDKVSTSTKGTKATKFTVKHLVNIVAYLKKENLIV